MKKEKILVLVNGQKLPVVGEEGKYYICDGDVKFRKLSPSIAHIDEVEAEAPATEEKPKSKAKSSAKKKSAEKEGEKSGDA